MHRLPLLEYLDPVLEIFAQRDSEIDRLEVSQRRLARRGANPPAQIQPRHQVRWEIADLLSFEIRTRDDGIVDNGGAVNQVPLTAVGQYDAIGRRRGVEAYPTQFAQIRLRLADEIFFRQHPRIQPRLAFPIIRPQRQQASRAEVITADLLPVREAVGKDGADGDGIIARTAA